LWRTPTDDSNRGGQQDAMKRIAGGHTVNLQDQVTLAAWPTTTKTDAQSSARHGYMLTGNKGTTLLDAARLASWSTPSARDWEDTPGMSESGTNPDGTARTRIDQLPRQAHGFISSGSPAETAKPGQLNPAFSRWLMGYPVAWCQAAIRTMRAMPTRQRKRG